jgi:hypothetical protein
MVRAKAAVYRVAWVPGSAAAAAAIWQGAYLVGAPACWAAPQIVMTVQLTLS